MQFSILSVLVVAATLTPAFAAPAAGPVTDAALLEKRCDRDRFTVCNTLCNFGCNVPGCPTCGAPCSLKCAQDCAKDFNC